MAFGLPVEGEDGPFLGDGLGPAPTCEVTATVAEARAILGGAGDDAPILVVSDGLVVGEVDAGGLEGAADGAPLLDVMRPVPSTVRPSVTAASVAGAGGGSPVVTSSDGRLLGRADVAADSPDAHDHDHDHGDGGDERYEEELASVMQALHERFGDREVSDEEVRDFLRERLLAEGQSAEEAEALLREMEGGP